MATEPIESEDAKKANNASHAEKASAALDSKEVKDTHPPAHLSAAKETCEDITRQLAQLSAYRIEKYRLSKDEQELLLELLNEESLEPDKTTAKADCFQFTYNDFSLVTNRQGQNLFYSDLIEKVTKRIQQLQEYNNRTAQMTFSCLYSKNVSSLEIALIIIKYAHFNLVAHHNPKMTQQLSDAEYYPKKFNKITRWSDDAWGPYEFSYTAKRIVATLAQEISFTQLFYNDGPIAHLYHLLDQKIAAIKAKMNELPIKKKPGKQKFKQDIKDGTLSITITDSPGIHSPSVIINHDKLIKHAVELKRDTESNGQNKFARLNIANLITSLQENDTIESNATTTRKIAVIENKIKKLQYIISQCRPLSNRNKPAGNHLTAASTREILALNIFDNIINDANLEIHVLLASIHYVVEKPTLAVPVPVRRNIRSATPPPESPDIVLTLSSPNKTLPPAPRFFWQSLRSPSPEPEGGKEAAPSSNHSSAIASVNSLFPPAGDSAPPIPVNDSLPSDPTVALPKPDKDEDHKSCNSCCFL